MLLGRDVAPVVAERMAADTAGNPLALLECGRLLTPVQRAGAAELPSALPVPARLREVYERELFVLPADGWAAALLAAASHDQTLAPVAAALADRGLDTAECLDRAAGVLELTGPVLAFRHPLLRSAAWHRAGDAERRQAHAALAAVLSAGAARTWHRAEAALGYDRELALELAAIAQSEGARRGYAAASVAYERAARLVREPAEAAALLAPGRESARLAGDGVRARRLAGEVLDGPAGDADRASALFVLGQLEEYTGTFSRARELLAAAADAADAGGGRLLLRVLVELGGACYLLDDQPGNWQAAARAVARADDSDPEQAMLAAYLSGAAYVFAGQPEEGAPRVVRALELLESEPSLRDDPRHLSLALLCARWLLDPSYVIGGVSVVEIGWRRIRSARSQGALGSLALGLSLAAGGLGLVRRPHPGVRAGRRGRRAAGRPGLLGQTGRGPRDVGHGVRRPGTARRRGGPAGAGRGHLPGRPGLDVRPPHLSYAAISCAAKSGDLSPGRPAGRGGAGNATRAAVRCSSRSGWRCGWSRRTSGSRADRTRPGTLTRRYLEANAGNGISAR